MPRHLLAKIVDFIIAWTVGALALLGVLTILSGIISIKIVTQDAVQQCKSQAKTVWQYRECDP